MEQDNKNSLKNNIINNSEASKINENSLKNNILDKSSIDDKTEASINQLDSRKKTINKILFGWIKDNYDKAFLIVLLIAFIIRVSIFLKTNEQALWYDAANYLAAAKTWSGIEMRDVWYYRRGFFWPLFSSFFFLTGIGENGIRFSIVLFSTGITASSYFLIKDMFNKKLALAVSICLSLSWIILFFTGRPLTEIPATFFIITSLVFFWKGYVLKQSRYYIYLFALFYALASLTRLQYLLFIPVFLIFIFTNEKFKMFKNKSLWMAFLIFFIIFIPHWILYYQHYGNPVTDILAHYFRIGVTADPTIVTPPRDYSRLHVYFLDMPYVLKGTTNAGIYSTLSEIFYILFLIGIPLFFIDLIIGYDKIFKNKIVQNKLFVLLWIVTLFLVLGYVTKDYTEQRYIMPALPFIYLIAVYPIFSLQNILSKNMKIDKRFILIILFAIIIVLLIPNYQWGISLIEAKKTSYAEIREAGLWLKEHSNPGDIIISASEPQIAYYSEISAYTQGRDEEHFLQRIEELKPRFLMLSMFESHPQWMMEYPQKNSDKLTPVFALEQNSQPVLIIYQFNPSQNETINKT